MICISTTDITSNFTTTTMTSTTMTTVAIVVFYEISKCFIPLHSRFDNVATIEQPRGLVSSCENRCVEATNAKLIRNAPPLLELLVPPPTN